MILKLLNRKLKKSSWKSFQGCNAIRLTFFILFIFFTSIYAEIDPDNYLLSNLIKNSKLITTGSVIDININSNSYAILLEVNNCILGNLSNNIIRIVLPLNNGFYLPDEPYLEKDKNYLLFLKTDNNEVFWEIIGKQAGVLDVSMFEDIKEIVDSYIKNNNLFSIENFNAVSKLFEKLIRKESKKLLLNDIEKIVDKENISFIDNLFEHHDKDFKKFSIRSYGKLGVERKADDIVKLLTADNDLEIKFNCLVALGNIKNKENIDIIINYLIHPDQGIRRAAIEALGNFEYEKIIESFVNVYPLENDFGNRVAIVTVIANMRNLRKVKDTLSYFKTIENDSFVYQFIIHRL